MGDVVDALRALGATIHDVGAPGHLPVEVVGGSLAGGEVAVRGDVSSQFLYAALARSIAVRVFGARISGCSAAWRSCRYWAMNSMSMRPPRHA